MHAWNDGTDILMHHGILGQKWGVRRYQNFDGSYTQAGLKRYNKSQQTYKDAKELTKQVKGMVRDTKKKGYYEDPKTGKLLAVDKDVLKQAKRNEKLARKRMNKDYRHLAQDKKADKGKQLYSEGKRITNNRRIVKGIAEAASLASIGVEYANRMGYLSTKDARMIQYASAGATITSGILSLISEIPNNQLRAYYSHTSNY